MQTPNERFPSLSQAVLLLLANFLLQYIVWAGLYDVRRRTGITDAQIQPLVMVITYGILLALIVHFCRLTYGDLMHSTKSSLSATFMLLVPPVLLLVPFVILLDDAAMSVIYRLLPLSRWEEQAFARMVSDDLPAIVATCILAPVLEEMLFRGVLLRAFLNLYPRWAAVSYSAFLFGAAHLNLYQFVLAFFLGLLLGWLFERSRSLLPCIALHAAVNSAIVALTIANDGQSDSLLGEVGVATWAGALVAAGIGAFMLHRVLCASVGKRENAV